MDGEEERDKAMKRKTEAEDSAWGLVRYDYLLLASVINDGSHTRACLIFPHVHMFTHTRHTLQSITGWNIPTKWDHYWDMCLLALTGLCFQQLKVIAQGLFEALSSGHKGDINCLALNQHLENHLEVLTQMFQPHWHATQQQYQKI